MQTRTQALLIHGNQEMIVTPEEYYTEKKILEHKHKTKVLLLNRQYAMAHNPINIFDIIQDRYQILKVESIQAVTYPGEFPQCMYSGCLLTKKLIEFKSLERGRILQQSVQKINGVEYKYDNQS